MTRLLVSTVVRGAPLSEGGRLLKVDFTEERVLASVPIYPSRPDVADAGRRGNARGGRGIVGIGGGRYAVADYHTIRIYREDLREEDRVSTPRMAGLHELHWNGGTLMATATTIDAVLEVDLDRGREVACLEPRTWGPLMDDLELPVSDRVAPEADHRVDRIAEDLAGARHHLHLNAVAAVDGRLLCFLNRMGAVVDLDAQSVLIRDETLRGGHNLVPYLDGVLVNSSLGGELVHRSFGGDRRGVDLRQEPGLDRVLKRKFAGYHLQRVAGRVVSRLAPPSRPFFVRGLAVEGARAYVGVSPAGIIEIDLLSGNVLRSWLLSNDVRECVHGLCVVE